MYLFFYRYVKFILYTASRVIFLWNLIFAALSLVVTSKDPVTDDATDEEIRDGYLKYRNAHKSDFVPKAVLLMWILGIIH